MLWYLFKSWHLLSFIIFLFVWQVLFWLCHLIQSLASRRLDKIGVYATHTLPLCINTHLYRNSICDLTRFWSTLSASKQHGSYREVCLWTGPEPGWQVRHHSLFYPSMFLSQLILVPWICRYVSVEDSKVKWKWHSHAQLGLCGKKLSLFSHSMLFQMCILISHLS